MMKLGWLVAALVFGGCASNDDDCTISVTTMTAEDAGGHVTITGDFADAQPLLDLRSMDGMHHIVACVNSGSSTADCDVSGLAPGGYTVGFQESCFDDHQNPGDPSIGGAVPETLTIN